MSSQSAGIDPSYWIFELITEGLSSSKVASII